MRRYMRSIGDIFGESPFKPLYEHAKKACEAAYALEDIIKAYCDKDTSGLSNLSDRIASLEHEADKIKQDVRRRLPYSVLLPVKRSDILEFLKPQDSISDSAEDLAKLMTLADPYELPVDIKEGLTEIMAKTTQILDAYIGLVKKLSELSRTAFRRKGIKEALDLVSPVEELEHQIDVISIGLSRKVFKLEDKLGALGVYHLSRIVELLSDVSDYAARAADRLRTMLFR